MVQRAAAEPEEVVAAVDIPAAEVALPVVARQVAAVADAVLLAERPALDLPLFAEG